MTAASRENRTTLNWGLALSLLLHLVFTILSQFDSLPDVNLHLPEQVMEVEVVREKPPPPKAIEQSPPAPPPQRPEPPPQQQPAKPVAPPQLQHAPIAEQSSAPKRPAAQDQGISFERRNTPPPKVGELTQSAQDFILAQVLRMWRFDTSILKGSDLTLSMTILIERDGTLSDTLNKNAPWNPSAVIRGYDQMPDGTIKRSLESMMLALRMAQPLQLPPDDGKGWPRRMIIRFRPGDL